MDLSTSDPLWDLTVFASLLDRQSPSLPRVGIHTRQERGRCSVRPPNRHMRMQRRYSMIERDITNHPDHFVLTVDENLLVHFSLGIEQPQRCSTQGSDSCEMGTGNLILLGKLYEAGQSLVSLVEDHSIVFCSFPRVQ